jgi:hypothetical protein
VDVTIIRSQRRDRPIREVLGVYERFGHATDLKRELAHENRLQEG